MTATEWATWLMDHTTTPKGERRLILLGFTEVDAIVAHLARLVEAEADADRGWFWAENFVNYGHMLPQTDADYRADAERHHAALARRETP